MAAGDSIISICNSALVALGEDTIVALTDPTKRAVLCNSQYDPARRSALRAFPWNCAKTVALLAADATPPVAVFDNSFTLPADCLRVLELPDAGDAVWQVWGRKIMVNGASGPLTVMYLKDLADPTVFDPLLVDAMSLNLAITLALPLTQSVDKQKMVQAQLDQTLRDARLASSQEASARAWDDDVWLRARR